MNGRQINTCIRMGQCIANDMKEPVSKEVIKQVLSFII
uniref:Uncharacterized protein n=1 Tax=viral metagenome TaxID=1070528 RepID=A0A6C0H1R7_9ZZZZ